MVNASSEPPRPVPHYCTIVQIKVAPEAVANPASIAACSIAAQHATNRIYPAAKSIVNPATVSSGRVSAKYTPVHRCI
jgi:hypothetical protein